MSNLINISICLSDIPKDKIKSSEKNGKKYLNICVAKRKEADQFENTHTVYVSQTKEEKGTPKTYIGNAKEIVFQSFKNAEQIPNDNDDLPF